jgi:hypothetical protein
VAARDLALKMTGQFPATLMGTHVSAAGSSAGATAAAAGQLCTLLELMCRAEMSVTQHCNTQQAAEPNHSSSSSSSKRPRRPLNAGSLFNVSNNLITFNLVTPLQENPTVRPLVTPSSPCAAQAASQSSSCAAS